MQWRRQCWGEWFDIKEKIRSKMNIFGIIPNENSTTVVLIRLGESSLLELAFRVELGLAQILRPTNFTSLLSFWNIKWNESCLKLLECSCFSYSSTLTACYNDPSVSMQGVLQSQLQTANKETEIKKRYGSPHILLFWINNIATLTKQAVILVHIFSFLNWIWSMF